MSHCLDTDTLVSLGAALDWDTEGPLRHLSECKTCQEQLGHLASIHNDLAAETEPEPGFTDRVLRTLDVNHVDQPRITGGLSAFGILNPILAGMTVFVAIAYTSGGGGGQAQTELVPAVVISVAAAGATWWWNRTHVADTVASPQRSA